MTAVHVAPATTGRATSSRAVLAATAGLGLAIMVVGTFLPWLRSGSTQRNSYTADGLVRRLLATDGITHALLMMWPFLSVLCAVAVALLLMTLFRTGGTLALVCAVAVGIVSVRILATGSHALIGVDRSGPGLTLAGCALTASASLAVLLLSARHRPTSAPIERSEAPR